METCTDDSQLLAYVQGALPPADRDPIDVHLGRCAACCELAAETAKLMEAESLHAATGMGTTEMPAGSYIGRYELVSVLGRGGAGVVYAARDPELHRRIAIKVLRLDVLERDDDDSRARLLREARAMARVSHPNVVAIFDVGVWSEQVFVAMELVQGLTLRGLFREGSTPVRTRVELVIQAGRGLCAAHAAGLVHRDFKPENVLVGDDGRVRVTDFGLAKPARASVTQAIRPPSKSLYDAFTTVTLTGRMTGTPAYMAPEQFTGSAHDARVDQFAFCVVLHEALYGARPFAGDKLVEIAREVLEGRIAPPKAPLSPDIPEGVHAIVLRGLSREPDERYPTLADLLADLDALVNPVTLVSASLSPPPSPAPPRRRSRALPIALVALAALVVAAVPVGIARRHAARADASPSHEPSHDEAASAIARAAGLPTASVAETSPAVVPVAAPAAASVAVMDADRARADRTVKHGARVTAPRARGAAGAAKASARPTTPRAPDPLGDRVQDPF